MLEDRKINEVSFYLVRSCYARKENLQHILYTGKQLAPYNATRKTIRRKRKRTKSMVLTEDPVRRPVLRSDLPGSGLDPMTTCATC